LRIENGEFRVCADNQLFIILIILFLLDFKNIKCNKNKLKKHKLTVISSEARNLLNPQIAAKSY